MEAVISNLDIYDPTYFASGIPADRINYIFQRNTKLASATEHTNSMGLGSSIVQELARLLNIQVDVNSKLGKTEFILRFEK